VGCANSNLNMKLTFVFFMWIHCTGLRRNSWSLPRPHDVPSWKCWQAWTSIPLCEPFLCVHLPFTISCVVCYSCIGCENVIVCFLLLNLASKSIKGVFWQPWQCRVERES
jgi:hypothetical protein